MLVDPRDRLSCSYRDNVAHVPARVLKVSGSCRSHSVKYLPGSHRQLATSFFPMASHKKPVRVS